MDPRGSGATTALAAANAWTGWFPRAGRGRPARRGGARAAALDLHRGADREHRGAGLARGPPRAAVRVRLGRGAQRRRRRRDRDAARRTPRPARRLALAGAALEVGLNEVDDEAARRARRAVPAQGAASRFEPRSARSRSPPARRCWRAAAGAIRAAAVAGWRAAVGRRAQRPLERVQGRVRSRPRIPSTSSGPSARRSTEASAAAAPAGRPGAARARAGSRRRRRSNCPPPDRLGSPASRAVSLVTGSLRVSQSCVVELGPCGAGRSTQIASTTTCSRSTYRSRSGLFVVIVRRGRRSRVLIFRRRPRERRRALARAQPARGLVRAAARVRRRVPAVPDFHRRAPGRHRRQPGAPRADSRRHRVEVGVDVRLSRLRLQRPQRHGRPPAARGPGGRGRSGSTSPRSTSSTRSGSPRSATSTTRSRARRRWSTLDVLEGRVRRPVRGVLRPPPRRHDLHGARR